MERKTERLLENEFLSLKKDLKSFNLTGFILFLLFLVLVHLLVFYKTEMWLIPNYEAILVIGTMSVFYFGTMHFTRDIREEILMGNKVIEFFKIDRKYDYIDKRDRFSEEFQKFVIVALEQEFVVSETEYNCAEISDYLAVHKTPKREDVLKIEIIKNNILE